MPFVVVGYCSQDSCPIPFNNKFGNEPIVHVQRRAKVKPAIVMVKVVSPLISCFYRGCLLAPLNLVDTWRND